MFIVMTETILLAAKLKQVQSKQEWLGVGRDIRKIVDLIPFNWVSKEAYKPHLMKQLKKQIFDQCYGHFLKYYVKPVKEQNKQTNEETLKRIFRITFKKGAWTCLSQGCFGKKRTLHNFMQTDGQFSFGK